MNNYKYIKAKVLRVDEEEHKFVIEVENRIYKVAQIDFQRRQPAPERLNCVMITTHLGKVFIAQNIEHLMRKHYKENDEVNFKIKMALGNFYHLEHRHAEKRHGDQCSPDPYGEMPNHEIPPEIHGCAAGRGAGCRQIGILNV